MLSIVEQEYLLDLQLKAFNSMSDNFKKAEQKLKPMNEEAFEQHVEETLKQIRETLIIKGREYRRGDNPFHNFDEGKRLTGQIRERVIDGFALKHQISINDMVNDLEKGINPKKEVVDEKFNDFIIYQIIKKISILDKL